MSHRCAASGTSSYVSVGREDSLISVHQLTKRYGGQTVLSDVTFEALPGRVTGFLGPNGAGKSTTIRLMLGLDRPTKGYSLVEGMPYQSLTRPLTRVGAQFDGSGAHEGRTARDHLLWVSLSNGISRRRIDDVLDMVGLTDAARKRVGTFSLGMKQRLGIATALLGDPACLIFDEPTNGLDASGILWLRGLLRDLAAHERTVLVSSHLMSEVQLVADDVVVIAHGKIVKQGVLTDLLEGQPNLEEAYFQWVGRE
ncbi:ABC transporter ATP-binding protein [Olsenella profusa]|uniref:ABC transporter ATP-binding protein n=1 Tax=Olsenella profusa TaxID=138595 RepID=UPI0027D91048|nr:ATP-binding cassette domain-containing protein [Olsenella profusa]